MEGDTELGLLVKNTIDAIELPVFNVAQLHPRHVMAQARERLMARLASLRPR
jgi:predicted lipid carrier protein YhbT